MAEESKERVLLHEDFSDGMENWWVEGSQRTWVQDGRLHMKADPASNNEPGGLATAWCKLPISGDARVEFEAHVVSSYIGANNINFFLFYSDPTGRPLYETRDDRPTASYQAYHNLNGYIFTFLRDHQNSSDGTPTGKADARFRMRRCPGFNLLTETYDPMGVVPGRTYHVVIIRKGGRLSFAVDDKVYLEYEDKEPIKEGLIGLRTFRTYLWWDNIRVTALK